MDVGGPHHLQWICDTAPPETHRHLPADPIRFRLFYDTDSGVPLPPSTAEATLGTFEATGLDGVLSKWNETGKINMHLKADSSGLISVDKAECVLDLTEQVSMGPQTLVTWST